MNAINPIKLIGIGGIGTNLMDRLAHYLLWASPTTPVTLVDGDVFDDTNRDRQRFSQIGKKAWVAASDLRNAFPELVIHSIDEYVSEDNAVRIIREGDVVFLAADNNITRRLVSDRCEDLNDVTLISGGNDVLDGSVHVYARKGGLNLTLPLANEFHPEIMYPKDRHPSERGCDEQRESDPQLILVNNLIAAWMLTTFYAIVIQGPLYDDLYIDAKTGASRSVRRQGT